MAVTVLPVRRPPGSAPTLRRVERSRVPAQPARGTARPGGEFRTYDRKFYQLRSMIVKPGKAMGSITVDFLKGL
ncbi:hypothetical protein ES703_89352 [subsurface metagenome]